MAIRQRRLKGVAKSARIEFDSSVVIPGSTVVEIVMRQESASVSEGRAGRGLLASLRQGFYLGCGPYLDRDEFYGETGRRSGAGFTLSAV
jgi:hypothetical protein